ncbi:MULTISPECIES: 3-mercaptopyruvate sulfurtransferase [Edwardsiella]|uniref:3-mercaptopyruvate sulfurtransferase n=2 Tax=Edwardsiella anguillarum TaxID=1821960 RepID=A0A076LY19_9GAMM|nr:MULTISPECIES: 3-mercaptopyruvate sulfurtransferase [Edwardsiella]AIJ10314.1 Thiosulfate sulfurtransferase, rhodanese [Edwardsiella anguillarum ET080813]KAB0592034.1 3-mercaptopyruvate sulfurtransferase [Edwardsiella anguillarum]UBU94531.1 3-mercaptopyruvate sulfurtransferase [Edwardsiella sp. LADL05-105]UOU77520.1 3-mercaptopyruvate sulfurtransferase [Edwardsiella anguillarum]WHP82158.1 3-mercaptopyruvate sulfurtransferase [Edwardsiella anguillarum]
MSSSLFVTPQWLAAHLADQDIQLLDARLAPPGPRTDPVEPERLPGALRFDIDALSDHASPLPHMLPSAADFGAAMRALGVDSRRHLVIYDDGTLFSAPRAWWMLRAFGAQRVSLLAGGLAAWQRLGLPLRPAAQAITPQGHFPAQLDTRRLRSAAQVLDALGDSHTQLIDARAAARFRGAAPEPRLGLRSGHIPGSHNLPWDSVVRDGALKTPEELRTLFRQAGIDLQRPIIASCGSGVTAAVLLLALAALGIEETALYDGAWSEWGADDTLPIAR